MATNVHGTNAFKTLNGKRLGLSDYKIALADSRQSAGESNDLGDISSHGNSP